MLAAGWETAWKEDLVKVSHHQKKRKKAMEGLRNAIYGGIEGEDSCHSRGGVGSISHFDSGSADGFPLLGGGNDHGAVQVSLGQGKRGRQCPSRKTSSAQRLGPLAQVVFSRGSLPDGFPPGVPGIDGIPTCNLHGCEPQACVRLWFAFALWWGLTHQANVHVATPKPSPSSEAWPTPFPASAQWTAGGNPGDQKRPR